MNARLEVDLVDHEGEDVSVLVTVTGEGRRVLEAAHRGVEQALLALGVDLA